MSEVTFIDTYDVIVVGAGHAGCEAALASARMGSRTLLLTINLDSVALMPCNPSIGGPAKGHVVREIDALGGEMARNTDRTMIQIRMLNTGKGPAVQALRAQSDKKLYALAMKQTLEDTPNLTLRQAQVEELVIQRNETTGQLTVQGVVIANGLAYGARTVVLTTGTFLKGRIIMGDWTASAGRAGEQPSVQVSNNLAGLGFPLHRLKTGTPPRIDARTIDFSRTILQPGSSVPLAFSFSYSEDDKPEPLVPPAYPKVFPNQQLDGWRPQLPCYLVHTNQQGHDLIRANLHRAPMFTGVIEGVGPRYCPSIEDKVVRFADKQSHQLFLEPEGWLTNEVYVQGANTSLPADVQLGLIRSIPALEKAEIMRFGYAVEYDAVPSTEIRASMESKRISNLFLAGQINGTSGYEEAAGQGLLAGINAALRVQGRDPFILKREQAYIAVMIDDLTTKEIHEPYRLMTSRAEYRLLLRSDNADLRLTALGYELGLISQERYLAVENKRDRIEEYLKKLGTISVSPQQNALFVEAGLPTLERGMKASDYLRRPEVDRAALPLLLGEEIEPEIAEQVEIEGKYRVYINKQEQSVDKMRRLEDTTIPDGLDYEAITGLRKEARQRLLQFKPATLGQASRLSGVNPADIAVLMVHLQRRTYQENRAKRAEQRAS
ncbi:MAG TPA: tRNA uridine-5-carboxymethylaminomethyl(34) synthesis enzyme MnmG [Chloroflexia bacterium]|nr:tRNA uridine-5-carboxymethylaminomethyl(34) synthesis enzyme MnmG [Chloroflexia bacterium]